MILTAKRLTFLLCGLTYEFALLLQFPSPTLLTIQLMRNEHDKVEFAAASIDVTHLTDVFLSVPPERREKHEIFLQRWV